MKNSDIIYQPDQVRSFVIMGGDNASSVESYLVSLLSAYNNLYTFIDKELVIRSPFVRDLAVELQEMGCPMRAIEAVEESKTIESVLEMCSWLMEKGADRDAVIVGIGGGMTTDMVGFAAGIYKRGVRFVNVPTTLLAMIDASLGGKAGVNFEKYKNMLGVIRQPLFTFIWPELLTTLPRRDFLSGAAEMLKTFMIEDNGNYRKAADMLSDMSCEFSHAAQTNGNDEKNTWTGILDKHRKVLSELIAAAAQIKAGIVSCDPFETGERRKLNLGHTFAHAIETLAQIDGGERFSTQGYPVESGGVTHGEAVAMGIVLAARLADRYFRKDTDDPTSLEAKVSTDLREAGIPCRCPYSVQEMAEVMKKDKKAQNGKIHFVLPRSIGNVETVELGVEDVCRLMA